jgi:hypothetical protein
MDLPLNLLNPVAARIINDNFEVLRCLLETLNGAGGGESSRLGEFFFSRQGLTTQGLIAVTPGIISGGATTYHYGRQCIQNL